MVWPRGWQAVLPPCSRALPQPQPPLWRQPLPPFLPRLRPQPLPAPPRVLPRLRALPQPPQASCC